MLASFLRSLSVIFQIFVMVAAGYTGRKTNALKEKALDGTMDVMMTISLPASVLAAAQHVEFSSETVNNVVALVLITLLNYVLIALISFGSAKVFHLKKDLRTIFVGTSVFKNIAFLGMPMCVAVLGQSSAFYVAFCMTIFTIIIWTFGVMLYSGQSHFKIGALLKNSSLICCVIMVVIILLRIDLPQPVWDVLDMAGSTCTPLSLIIMGIMLADVNLLDLLRKPIYYLSSLYTLLVAPAVMLLLILIFKPAVEVSAVMITLAAVPSATMNPLLAKRYGSNGEMTSMAVLHGMLLSLLTMPIIITVLLHVIGYQ